MECCLEILTPCRGQASAGYLQDDRLAMVEAPVEAPRAVLADELPHLTPAGSTKSAAPSCHEHLPKRTSLLQSYFAKYIPEQTGTDWCCMQQSQTVCSSEQGQLCCSDLPCKGDVCWPPTVSLLNCGVLLPTLRHCSRRGRCWSALCKHFRLLFELSHIQALLADQCGQVRGYPNHCAVSTRQRLLRSRPAATAQQRCSLDARQETPCIRIQHDSVSVDLTPAKVSSPKKHHLNSTSHVASEVLRSSFFLLLSPEMTNPSSCSTACSHAWSASCNDRSPIQQALLA